MSISFCRPAKTGAFSSWCLLGVVVATVSGVACRAADESAAARPHVAHVNLPTHQVWRVVSVQPYEGLEEVELVKVNWPTADTGRMAFALTREDLKSGDPICLDHVEEIDTLWAHPVPDGGCAARDAKAAASQ